MRALNLISTKQDKPHLPVLLIGTLLAAVLGSSVLGGLFYGFNPVFVMMLASTAAMFVAAAVKMILSYKKFDPLRKETHQAVAFLLGLPVTGALLASLLLVIAHDFSPLPVALLTASLVLGVIALAKLSVDHVARLRMEGGAKPYSGANITILLASSALALSMILLAVNLHLFVPAIVMLIAVSAAATLGILAKMTIEQYLSSTYAGVNDSFAALQAIPRGPGQVVLKDHSANEKPQHLRVGVESLAFPTPAKPLGMKV